MCKTFKEKGFKEGDVIICTSSNTKAPIDIKEKAFVLQYGSSLFLNKTGSDCYTGEGATWRKATESDGEMVIHEIVEDWENGWRFVKPLKNTISVKDILK